MLQRVLVALLQVMVLGVAHADTKPIPTLRAVVESADWIAVGVVDSIEDAGCIVRGFGAGKAAVMRVSAVWKGAIGGSVTFVFFPERSVVTPVVGGSYVVAFIPLKVSCENVTFDFGLLPINGAEAITSTLVNEPPRQPVNLLRQKVMRAIRGESGRESDAPAKRGGTDPE